MQILEISLVQANLKGANCITYDTYISITADAKHVNRERHCRLLLEFKIQALNFQENVKMKSLRKKQETD